MWNRNILLNLFVVILPVVNILVVTANPSLYVTRWHPDHPFAESHNARMAPSRYNMVTRRSVQTYHDQVVPATRKSRKNRQPASRKQIHPNGRFLSGSREVLLNTLHDYVLGFCAGYATGALVGLPTLIFRPVGNRMTLVSQINGRLSRMNVRSLQWGLCLGEVLGTFKGCDTAVGLIRYPKRDEWNQVYGCASAGAFLARKRKLDIHCCRTSI